MWVKQADIDDGHVVGVSIVDARRVRGLEQEVRELRRADEILKRAASFFGAKLDRQHRKYSRSSTRTRTTSLRVARSESSHLHSVAGGSECVLRRGSSRSVGVNDQRRCPHPGTGEALEGQLPGLRGSQALEGNPPQRAQHWPRPNRSVDARCRHRGRNALEAGQDDRARSDCHATCGPGEARVRRDSPEPALGDRSDVRADLGWRGCMSASSSMCSVA